MLREFLLNTLALPRRLLQRARSSHRKSSPIFPFAQSSYSSMHGSLRAALALFLPAFCFLYQLGAYPLRDNNEGLYAEIAREMLESGNFIIPHLNGVPYIEKPPLLYWLIASSIAIFGPAAASARLVSAGAMFLLAIYLYLFCRRFGHARAGLYANLVLATAVPAILLSRTVLFDPLLTALLGGYFLSFLEWYQKRRRSRLLLCSLLLALGVLEKGAVAIVLAAGSTTLFFMFQRDKRSWRAMADPAAIALFIAVALPWHLMAAFEQRGFSWFYFINEHVLRFLGTREPQDYHVGPFYYYVPRTLVLLLPWTPLLLLLVRSSSARDPGMRTWVRLCQAWILFPFAFFSLSQAKADYYLLVCVPAVSLWSGLEIERRLQNRANGLLAHCWGISLACTIVALWIALNFQRIDWRSWKVAMILLAWVGIYATAARCFAVMRTAAARETALVVVGLLVMPLLLALLHVADERSIKDSSWHLAQAIRKEGSKDMAVFVYRDFEDVFSSLPFYLDRTVKVIDSDSRDLQFGCRITSGTASACISSADFNRYRERFPVVVAVRNEHAGAFRKAAGQGEWLVKTVGEKQLFFSK